MPEDIMLMEEAAGIIGTIISLQVHKDWECALTQLVY
jgi:hypothetical protein